MIHLDPADQAKIRELRRMADWHQHLHPSSVGDGACDPQTCHVAICCQANIQKAIKAAVARMLAKVAS